MKTTVIRTLLALLLLPALLALAIWSFRSGVTQMPEASAVVTHLPLRKPMPAFDLPLDSPLLQAQQRSRQLVFLAVVEIENDPDRRGAALDLAVESVAQNDLEATLDWLPDQVTLAAAEMHPLLVRRWAELDAPAAAAWAARLPSGTVYHASIEEIAIAWGTADLSAAVNWAKALPEGADQQAAFMDLGYESARTEPITALVVACLLPATLARDDLMVHAVSQWAIGTSSDALDWALTVPDIGLRERLLGAISIAMAQQDGAAAATIAVTLLGPGEEQNRAAVAIVQRWAGQSPQLAASWVEQFPDTPARDAAIENLVTVWARRDGKGAAAWLQQLPDGSFRTASFSAFAQ